MALKILSPSYDQDPTILAAFIQKSALSLACSIPISFRPSMRDPPRAAASTHRRCITWSWNSFPGQDLEKFVAEQGPLPVAKTCDILVQVASALEESHRHLLVHRDLKPSNVIVMPDGQAKLLDFGLMPAGGIA